MTYAKERDQFIAQFCRQLPEGVYLKNGIYFRALDAASDLLASAGKPGRWRPNTSASRGTGRWASKTS
jgi:hypothetical protein